MRPARPACRPDAESGAETGAEARDPAPTRRLGGAPDATGRLNLHAGCVAAPGPDGRPLGLLILGEAGAGKSSLALEMLARGARLVSDDRTLVGPDPETPDALLAAPPEALAGLIEARFIGLLRLPHLAQARLAAACDLSRAEPERLPPPRRLEILGRSLPLVLGAGLPAAALLALLAAGGRPEPV